MVKGMARCTRDIQLVFVVTGRPRVAGVGLAGVVAGRPEADGHFWVRRGQREEHREHQDKRGDPRNA